jgi:hypothetical protein
VVVNPDLDAKLASFDAHAFAAVDFLIGWLAQHPQDLIALARGRRVWGHYRYENKNFLEYDVPTLLAEASEELADAINYIALRIERLSSSPARARSSSGTSGRS